MEPNNERFMDLLKKKVWADPGRGNLTSNFPFFDVGNQLLDAIIGIVDSLVRA
jgi:hypothetical protein